MKKYSVPLKHAGMLLLERIFKKRVHEIVDVSIRSDQLKKLFEYANIKVLDVGARGGPLGSFGLFAPFAHLFICEPDTEEIKKVEQELQQKGRWKSVTALPFALAAQSGTAVFHFAEKPGLSSLLEANRDEMKKFYSISGWSRIVRDVSVPTDMLDRAAKKFGFQDLSVIKLDTQGTELEILQSGTSLLPMVLAVYIETEFIPLYKNQPLFGDVNAFLEKQGFRLIDIKRTAHRRKTNAKPVYSKREMTWAHGLYFRTRHADGKELTPDEKIKLACAACAFEYFDYAVWLMEQSEMQAFLREHGLENISQGITCFANDFWGVLQGRLGFFQKRESTATMRTDRSYER